MKRLFYFKWLAIILALVFPLGAIYVSHHCYINAPLTDFWYVVAPVWQELATNQLHISTLWSPFCFHRLFIVRLLFIADYYLFAGNKLAIIVISFTAQAATLLLLLWQLKRIIPTDSRLFWLAAILFSALLFNPAYVDIWMWEIAVQQPLTVLGFTLTLLYLCRQTTLTAKSTSYLILLSIFCSLISANGVIIWATCFLALLLTRQPWRWTLLYLLAAAIVIAIYCYGQTDISLYGGTKRLVTDKLSLSSLILARTYFTLISLATAFSKSDLTTALSYGSLGLTAIFVIAFISYRRNQKRWQLISPELFWLLLATLAVASGILGSVARIQFGLAEAMSLRYGPLSATLWLSILACLLYYCTLRPVKLGAKLLKGLGIIFMLVVAHGYMQSLTMFIKEKLPLIRPQVKVELMALHYNYHIINPYDLDYTPNLSSPANLFIPYIPLLKQKHIAPFATSPDTHTIGQPIQQLGLSLSQQSWRGELLGINQHNTDIDTCQYQILKGLHAIGWLAYSPQLSDQIYLVDQHGVLRGLALTIPAQKETEGNVTKYLWSGFVSANSSSSPQIVKAYVRAQNGQNLYPIAGEIELKPNIGCTIKE